MRGFQRIIATAILVSGLALSGGVAAQTSSATGAAPATSAAAAPAPAAAKQPRYLIYFNEWSAYLSPRAKAIITKAANEAKVTHATAITVQARASATGTVQTNKYLAMTRASIVADQLEANGVPAAMVQQEPIGQTGSSDPTVFNRRVDIILHH